MDLRELATQVVDQRMSVLREIAEQTVIARKAAETRAQQPQITVQFVVPPEAFKITVNTPAPTVNVTVPKQDAPKVTVNVPQQPPPKVTVEAPQVTVTPSIEVKIPDRPKKARIKHSEGGTSTVELV